VKRRSPKARKRVSKKAVKSASPYGFKNPYVLKAMQYIEAIQSGRIPSCVQVKQACARQLRDLERWRTDPAYPFAFDEELGGRAAEFMEQLPHTQGPMAFEREDGSWNTLSLEPWQCFTETTLYGWVRKDGGGRRFMRSYEELPRGNGKSFKLSGALLYSFTEGEQGVEAYSAAVDREQAAKVYGEAEAMLLKRPDLAEELGLESSAHAIFQVATHSYAKALSREAKKTGDGKNVYFAAVDEFHAHPTGIVWGILDSGTGKRKQEKGRGPLIRIITTSGFNTAGACYGKRNHVLKILAGLVEDDSWFGIIYTIDEGDDWKDEECRAACSDHSHPGCVWRKANPNWGVSVDPVDFAAKANTAMQQTSEQNNFLTKHLDVWCNADQAWMDMSAWDRCGNPELRIESFADVPCFGALDLASKTDIAAKVRLFVRDEPHRDDEKRAAGETETHFYAFLKSYLPENATTDGRNAQYGGWVREGRIVVTPGDVLDFETVKLGVLEDRDSLNLRAVAFDPWQALKLSQELMAEAVSMVEVQPSVKNFSEPMKEWEALVLDGRFHHAGDACYRWQVSNVVCHRDAKDNIYPRKELPVNKIDGPVSTIMALNLALAGDSAPSDVSMYETERVTSV
jgi:phage terminase large subunit-like protein